MSNAERTRTRIALAVDLIMLALIVANLALIIFDWMFLNDAFRALLQRYVPAFYHFYSQTIHAHFFYIDLVFVGIFLLEILVRWGIAIWRHTYHRWWFYPFIHWYDVLGCIPISSFRFLRILRVFAVIPKLQRIGFVDLRTTAAYRTYEKYRDVLMEEITDRVTIKLLNGVQDGVQTDNPVTRQIVRDVIRPRQEALLEALAHRVQEAAAASYAPHRDAFRTYIEGRVVDAVETNEEIATIARLPGVGQPISTLIERAISDITFHVIDDMLHDVAALDNDRLIAEITEQSATTLLATPYDPRLNQLLQTMTIESIEVIKDHVALQQWKLEELAESPAS